MKPKTNRFDLTHDVKLSGKLGHLIPTMVMEAVPGDQVELGSDIFLRFAPLIAPVMHRIDVYCHYFFVPNRLVWNNWEDFITNEPTGGIPQITIDESLTTEQKKLLDYLGVPPPTGGAVQTNVNAMPMAAYQLIYNEYYRDENLVNEVGYELTDGINNVGELLNLQNRAWEHDYFTSCLPWPQKGDAVDIPLGTVELADDLSNSSPHFQNENGVSDSGSVDNDQPVGGDAYINVNGGGPTDKEYYDPDGSLVVGSTTINELRRAMRTQEWLEKNARGGTRYIEQIKAHFGVFSSDKRLQRPEYITGVKAPVVVSEVLNTTGQTSGSSLPQGNMAGHAVSVGKGYNGKYRVEEHGYIMGIMSVLPRTNYQQGIPKTYLREDPTDYYWPSFAHIGEQEVKQQELYAYGSDKNDTFGYVPRYSEYKYMQGRVAGDFRGNLDYWHLGRIFDNSPTLSKQFIECTPDQFNSRIFAVDNGDDNLYCELINHVKAKRPMPEYGTPLL
jgi:hypothetical protein